MDPSGDAANPFVEPFSVSGSIMTLYGPAVWRQPHPESPNLFCEPETPSDYMWSLSGSTLTIRNGQPTVPSCVPNLAGPGELGAT